MGSGVSPTVAPDDVETASDGDGLPDSIETRVGSDPTLSDTDGDGLTDAEEVAVGTDPLVPDSDGDGTRDPEDDQDADGVTNRAELTDGTQPFNADTDGDGVLDADEVRVGSDPLVSDGSALRKRAGQLEPARIVLPTGIVFERDPGSILIEPTGSATCDVCGESHGSHSVPMSATSASAGVKNDSSGSVIAVLTSTCRSRVSSSLRIWTHLADVTRRSQPLERHDRRV
jgi:hypothetical protein